MELWEKGLKGYCFQGFWVGKQKKDCGALVVVDDDGEKRKAYSLLR